MRFFSTFAVTVLLAATLLTAGRILARPAAALAAPLQTVNCDVDPAQIAPGATELDLLRDINSYRAAFGLAPVAFEASLQRAAAWKAIYMAQTGTFAHDDPDRKWTQRLVDCGYPNPSVSENLAAGADTAVGVMTQWQNSTDHNANLLTPEFTAVGLKRVMSNDQYGWYWVAVFGSQVITPLTAAAPVQ